MKTRYEYEVVTNRPYGSMVLKASNREEAREAKRELKSSGIEAKIIQRKYILSEQKEVR